jgi:AraC-like DNA-binding protein
MLEAAVERAIDTMWDRYNEPLTLGELADAAILSRYYFSRVFRVMTGTTPVRFLTAVRLYKAKNMLLETSMTVTEISYQVGYNSLGTFTSRFTRSVGISPARYRFLSHSGIPSVSIPLPRDTGRSGSISGRLHLPDVGIPVRVYVALFESVIVEGQPIACDIVDAPGTYRLSGVPDGEWFIRAAAVTTTDLDPRPWHRRPLFVSRQKWVKVSGDAKMIDINLRPVHTFDLPILLALPELDGQTTPALVPAQQMS